MDIYKEITDRIIAEMEQGIIPWEKPWANAGRCVSHTTGKSYSLLNQMLLGRSGEYVTFKQCQQEGISLTHTAGDSAFYRPSTDAIILPKRSQFATTAEYYSTAFHELTHSTGHSKRLNRLSETAFFGSEAYSKEELIAELGAAALVNHVGLETSHSLRNSAAYIQNWLAVLKNDKRFIVSASGKADKAISLILGC